MSQLLELSTHEKLSINLKEISQKVRTQLKAEFPGCIFSITTQYYSMGQSLHVSLMKSDIRIKKLVSEITEKAFFHHECLNHDRAYLETLQNGEYHQLSQYIEDYDCDTWNNGVFLTEQGHNLIKRVVDIINQYNWDHSDSQTDYFDVHFYLHLQLGKWDKSFLDGVN